MKAKEKAVLLALRSCSDNAHHAQCPLWLIAILAGLSVNDTYWAIRGLDTAGIIQIGQIKADECAPALILLSGRKPK